MITKQVPKESFLSRIKYDPDVLSNYKDIIKGIRKSGASEYKNILLDRVDEVEAGTLHDRVISLMHPIAKEIEQDKDLVKKPVDQLTVYVGEESYTIVDLARFYQAIVPTEIFILMNYYLRGADEISVSKSLVESFRAIPIDKTPYEDCQLSPLSWVNLSHLNLHVNSVIPALEADRDPLELTNGIKVTKHKVGVCGVIILNLSRNGGREWEKMKEFSEIVSGTRDGIVVFLITKYGLREMFSGRLLASSLEDLKEKVQLIQLGLGDRLGLSLEMGVDRKYSLSPTFDRDFDLDMSPMGDVIDLAIKSILYAQSPVVKSKTISFPNPRKLNVKQPRKKRKSSSSGDYYRVVYINKQESTPEWVSHKPSVGRADPKFYSSHYRRIWVVKEYLEKHSIPADHILDHDLAKGRRNKFGELIYKERYRIAIKVNGTDPVLTVKKYT